MTSPVDPQFSQRLTVAGQAVGTENPQLAYTLAQSGLSPTQIQAIGGFTNALNLHVANQLAADSGVTTNFTAQEQNSLQAIGSKPANPPKPPDNRNWFEKAADAVGSALADGGNFIFHNPVTHAVLTGLDWIGNVAHMPFRLVSAGVGGEDTQARDDEMKAMGYDPSSTTSQLAFMFNHGESQYHPLNNARTTYGDQLVDLAVQQQADPEQFQKDLEQMDPARAADLNTTLNSAKYKEAFAAVDALHISPGRDFANVLMAPFGWNSENNWVFKRLSGVIDAAYDWAADPTLIYGRVSTGLRVADALGRTSSEMTLTQKLLTKAAGGDGALARFVQRRGGSVQGVRDIDGIYKTLGVDRASGKVVEDTQYGRGMQQFIDRSKQFGELTKRINDTSLSVTARREAADARAQLYTQMDKLHGNMMPLLPEFLGQRVLPPKMEFNEGTVARVEEHHATAATTAPTATTPPAAAGGMDDPAMLHPDLQTGVKVKGAPASLNADGRINTMDKAALQQAGYTQQQIQAWELAKFGRVPLEKWAQLPGKAHPGAAQAKADRIAAQIAGPQPDPALVARALKLGRGPRAQHDALWQHFSGLANGKGAAAPQAGSVATLTRPQTEERLDDDLLGEAGPIADGTTTSPGAVGWETYNGKPIEDLGDAAQYMASTAALSRLANGQPAQQLMVMPGRISWWGERMYARKGVIGNTLGLAADKTRDLWINFAKDWHKLMPVDEESSLLSSLDQAGADDAARAALGKAQYNMLRKGTVDGQGFNYIKRAITRMERVNRRLTTTLPQTEDEWDLTNPSMIKNVERFARFYLDKYHARLLAAAYAAGDLGTRRAVVRGMHLQTFHASGMSRSPAGLKFMERFVGDIEKAAGENAPHQMYGLEDTDVVTNARGERVHVALSNAQLNTRVPMPPLKQMNQLALRFLMDGWYTSRGISAGLGALQSNRMDAFYGAIKTGWITSSAGGLRNALDELAGFMAKGMFSQFARGRQAWTQATADWKDESGNTVRGVRGKRIDASRDYLDLAKKYGQHGAREQVAERSGKAAVGLEQARRDFELAQKADKELAGLEPGSEEYDNLQEKILDRGILTLDDAQDQLAEAAKEAEQARALENAIHYKIPYYLRRFGDSVNDVLFGATASKLLRVFGPRWAPTPQQVGWVRELQDEERRALLRDGMLQTHYGDNYSALAGPQAAMNMARSGVQHRPYSYKPAGWGTVEPDGGMGLEDFAKYLQLHLGDPIEPGHPWVQTYHRTHDFQAARDAVRAYLDDPAMRRFLNNAEVVKTARDGQPVRNAEDLAQVKEDLADRISANLMHGLTKRGGATADDLAAARAQARGWGDMSPDEFANSGEELLHGTPREFNTFSGDRAHTNTGRGAGDRVYMTDSPRVARKFAYESGGPHGAQYFNDEFYSDLASGRFREQGVPDELAARVRAANNGEAPTAEPSPDVQERLVKPTQLLGGDTIEYHGVRHQVVTTGTETMGERPSAIFREWLDRHPDVHPAPGSKWLNLRLRGPEGPRSDIWEFIPADSKGLIKRIGPGQLDIPTSMHSIRRMAATVSKNAKDAEARRQAIRAFNAHWRAHGLDHDLIDLDNLHERLQHYITDTGRNSRSEFETFLSNQGVQASRVLENAARATTTRAEDPITTTAEAVRAFLAHRMSRGEKFAYEAEDGSMRTIATPDQLDNVDDDVLARLDEHYAFMVPRGSNPRTIRAKVYGKTIDLRTRRAVRDENGHQVYENGLPKFERQAPVIPADLEQALRAEGVWHPADHNGSIYGHERSKALTDWMRKNGYGKARVDDAHESGMESHVVLPEMIHHGRNNPVANFAQTVVTPQPNLINEKLLDQLAVADQIGIPDASWISHNVPLDERPAQTVGQLWAPYNAAQIPGGFPRGNMQMLSKAYQKVVTDQVDALSRNPLAAALYINARQHILDWEQYLVDEAGWAPEAAKEVAMRMSLAHAQQEAFKHIDNPHVASHFSLISRNFVNFERAQEDWLRRWGRAIRDNPAIVRKAQLTLHAATAAGLVEQDPTQPDNLYFVYPGSQLAIRLFNGAMKAVGLGEKVQIPVTGELTSQLQFLSPSMSQPFGLTVSPILAIPFKALASTVGQDHQLLVNSLDKALNGTLGSGRSWYEQILPPTINRIIRGVIQSDPGSQYGQAWANAAAALGAAGAFDHIDGNDPTALQNVQDAIGAQVRNNMVLNTLFGFFAPATPGVEFDTAGANTGGHAGTTADWSAHILGYKSLKVEAQQALADLGPSRFRLWWAAVHPHELIWDPTSGVSSHSKAGASNAYLPATLNAAKWMESNKPFLDSYGGSGGVGSYFVPTYQNIVGYDDAGQPIIGPQDATQQYNDIAYRAQLQDHLRELKPLSEIVPDIIIQRGESEYYRTKDAFDAQIEQANASGDRFTAKQLEDQWSTEKQDIYSRNPLLAQKNASFATNGSVQHVAIGQLRKLVDDHSAATTKAIGNMRDGVQILLDAYDNYTTGDQALSGHRGNAATAARTQLLETYQASVQAVAQQYPDLADLVRGVFRTP